MCPRKPAPRLQSTLGGSTVLGLGLSPSVRSKLACTMPGEVTFVVADSLADLLRLRTAAAAPMLAWELRPPSARRDASPSCADQADLAPPAATRALPTVAICGTAQMPSLSELRQLEHVQIVAMDAPDADRALWRALEQALASSIATALLGVVGPIDFPLVRGVMTVAVSRAGREVQVPEIAHALHMHARTLRRRLLAETGSMSVQELIGWARLLRVAWQLRQPGWALLDVANALSFSAASNLHRQVRRYTGRTIANLQSSGDPVAIVAECFRSALRDGAARTRMNSRTRRRGEVVNDFTPLGQSAPHEPAFTSLRATLHPPATHPTVVATR